MPTPAIYWIADRLAPKLKKQFLAAVLRLQARVSIEGIRRNSLYGSSNRLEVAFTGFSDDLKKTVAPTLNNVFETASRAAEGQILKRLGVSGRFDLVNELALQAASERSSLLVREITTQTRRALQNVIQKAIREGLPPRESAKQIKKLVGLTSRQANAVLNFRQSLRDAGVRSQQVEKQVNKYATKLHNERATNIARTETIRASNDGQDAAWRGARTQGLLDANAQKEWIAADDERLCPTCGALNGEKTAWDGAFALPGELTTISHPPAHPRCRCSVTLVFPKSRRR